MQLPHQNMQRLKIFIFEDVMAPSFTIGSNLSLGYYTLKFNQFGTTDIIPDKLCKIIS